MKFLQLVLNLVIKNNVGAIMADFQKKINQLNALANAQRVSILKSEDLIQSEIEKQVKYRAEAKLADNTASKLKAIISSTGEDN